MEITLLVEILSIVSLSLSILLAISKLYPIIWRFLPKRKAKRNTNHTYENEPRNMTGETDSPETKSEPEQIKA
ncbi:hypothetical protein [uncultured Oscillibacter sp.]|uniref:hypothetical protein n=1 Tax=uncultured Oscillibacter sp. TaxID=876091 RepID=UPI00262F0705|nr:hypothetical protein [uncultured Oscillibacter sp.]